ncbi:MAG: pectate lyase family protein [Planctomycetota bacterium]|jgi:hypothetical protein
MTGPRSYVGALGAALLVALSAAARAPGGEAGPPKLPAFPGAEGYGAASVGGRGGKVLKVTTLKPDGPGSLKWALAQDFPRIIVFDVSGVIEGGHTFHCGNSRVTVAGQTAPGAGITVDGNLIFGNYRGKEASDFTIRFLRVRPNFRGSHASGGDGIRLHGLRAILDHVSTSWSTDEAIQFSAGGTMQWCACEGSAIAWEGHHCHNYGPYFYACKHPQTLHHTLIAHASERCPAQSNTPFLDMRNVVIYNSSHGAQLGNSNAVNNYLMEGPGGPQHMRPNLPIPRPATPKISQHRSGKVFSGGNVLKPLRGPVRQLKGTGGEAHPAPKVTTHSAEEAYELVMAHAGCLPRDAVSKKTFKEARTGTGFMGRYVPEGGLMEGLTPGKPKPDADSDGMPDEWEKAHGLDPNDAADSSKIVPAGASKGDRHKGYTYIEFYINELADKLVEEAIAEYRKTRPQASGSRHQEAR